MDLIHRNALLKSLAETIADYRQNEITPITPSHVEKWLNQFDFEDQSIILAEMDTIMKRLYFSRNLVKKLLRSFVKSEIIAVHNPYTLLPHISFLRLQKKESSQDALLRLIDEILREDYKLSISTCGVENVHTYVYVDDGIYTGNRLRYNLTSGTNAAAWISNEAAPTSVLIICTLVAHVAGLRYVQPFILRAAREKDITVKWKHYLFIDNQRSTNGKVEFLWPKASSSASYVDVVMYVSNLRASLAQKNWRDNDLCRNEGIPLQEELFSSREARDVVEKAFLKKGVQIIAACQQPKEEMRPLGFEKIGSLGFGTLFVTYRNIANNCPLVLWWGNPDLPFTHPLGIWYPLFPRRTNSQNEL